MAVNSVTGIGSYNAYCQSCGRKYKANQLRKRPEDGLMVCPDDWEPIHPQKYWKVKPDTKPLPFTSSNDNKGDGQTDISGNSIAPSVNVSTLSEIVLSAEYLNNLTENTTVYKAIVQQLVTLPDGITLTIPSGGYIIVAGTKYGAGDYTGASTGW